MLTPLTVPDVSVPGGAPSAGRPAPALDAPLARRALLAAALLGLSADALLHPTLTGIALPLWVTLAATAFASLSSTAGRRLPREAGGWLAAAVLFALMVAWRDADLLQAANILVTVGALLMAAIATRQPDAALFAARVRDFLESTRSTLRTALAGFLPLAWREAVAPGERIHAEGRGAPALRAMALTAVLLVIFGALLRGADPLFASLVGVPEMDVGSIVRHLIMTTIFAWLTAGWVRAAFDRRPATTGLLVSPFSLTSLEITSALGALIALFALYVLTQLGLFFGGESFLRARTGLTASQYARQGFFQVVAVVLLVVPLLLTTRALLAPGRALERRHTLLSVPLLALTGAIVLSAASRMRLYVHYFGLTTDRLYPMAVMLWLTLVLAWLACTVLRGRGGRFLAGALGSGLVTLLLLDVMSPDLVVARVNIARATSAASDARIPLDVANLARLGGEAAPLAVSALLASPAGKGTAGDGSELRAQRCTAATVLLARWAPESHTAASFGEDGAWRRWNVGTLTALHTVRRSAAELRSVRRLACDAGRKGAPAAAARADGDG